MYQASEDIVRDYMTRPGVIPHWWQTPYRTTNATSYEQPLLNVWGEGEEWMRPKDDMAMKDALPIARHGKAADAFYHVLEYAEATLWDADSAILIGLRSEESLNRYGAVTRNPGRPDVRWCSKSAGKALKFYPIYDWTFEDVWTFLGKFKVKYNRLYDYMYAKGFNIPEMRVSSLIHEKAFKCLPTLHEFEPETYNNLIKRIGGIHTAALYGKEHTVYNTVKLPEAFKKWADYRDFLLETLPPNTAQTFRDRFADQLQNETVARQQVRQLLINDQDNLIPVKQMDDKEDPKKKWMALL